MLKEKIVVQTGKKVYPELTFEQLEKMVKLLNEGYSEEEAKEEALKP